MEKIRASDLSQGNIYKILICFGTPFLLANLLQSLYGAVDIAVVGWFCDSPALAATSMGSTVLNIFTNAIIGLTAAGSVLIGQYIGAKREDDAKTAIGTITTLFSAVALIVTVVMVLCAKPLLRLCNTPEESLAGAVSYVNICSFGFLFIFGYNAVSAMMRGMGDSRHPLFFVGIACLCNIVLDIVLVGAFSMGPAGAALATVASQGLSLVISVTFMVKRVDIFSRLRLHDLKVKRRSAKQIFSLGLPLMFQNVVTSISFMIIIALASNLGVAGTSALGIIQKINGFAMLPAISASAALSAFTAQNVAAGEYDRAKKTLFAAIKICLIIALAFFAWAQLAPKTMLSIFGGDHNVTKTGAAYLRTFSVDFLLVVFWFCFSGFFNGCGKTRFTMMSGVLATILFRIPLAYVADVLFPGNMTILGLAAPLASMTSIIASLIYIRSGRWKKSFLLHDGDEARPAVKNE